MKRHHSLAALTGLLAILSGCFFPRTEATLFPSAHVSEVLQTKALTKIFLKDGSMCIVKGVMTDSAGLHAGEGNWYSATGAAMPMGRRIFAYDSIVALTVFEEKITGASALGSVLGIAYSPIIPIAIYCLGCPKCCFGSCPTIYDSAHAVLLAEAFSPSISRLLEAEDLDKLNVHTTGSHLTLRVTNEALETHYMNQFSIRVVDHDASISVYPTPERGLVSFRRRETPLRLSNRAGDDLRPLLSQQDSLQYRSGSEMVDRFARSLEWDYVDIDLPRSASAPRLFLRYKNTLLSTVLFYDVVLASQGAAGLQWTEKMNTDSAYAAQFAQIYQTFAGLELLERKAGRWQHVTSFVDAGPLTWRETGCATAAEPGDSMIHLRLKFFPDNVLIDQIAFDTTTTPPAFVEREGRLVHASAKSKNETARVSAALTAADTEYIVTEPGDAYELSYDLPPAASGMVRSVFLRSFGYYNEWIRGSWIRQPDAASAFDINNIPATLERLAESWRANRALLEETFFRTRVQLKESIGGIQ